MNPEPEFQRRVVDILERLADVAEDVASLLQSNKHLRVVPSEETVPSRPGYREGISPIPDPGAVPQSPKPGRVLKG